MGFPDRRCSSRCGSAGGNRAGRGARGSDPADDHSGQRRPISLAVSPDGATVYTANALNDSVSVIDAVTNTITATVTVGDGPYGVALSPDGATVYTANYSGDSVSVINTATNTVVDTISVGGGPRAVAVSPDGATVYTADYFGESVSVIDTATNTVVGTIWGLGGPVAVAVSPDGATVYTANSDDSVSVIDTATSTVVDTIRVGGGPRAVAVSPDGATVYSADYFNDSVSVIDTATNIVVDTIIGPGVPTAVAVSPDGATVYTANSDDSVSVIDTATNTVTGTAAVGDGPVAVAVSPDGATVYTADYSGDSVSVLRDIPAMHTVTFDANGGTGEMAAQSANASTPLAPGTFTHDGYTFAGWNTTADGTGTSYADGADYAFTADGTLYAQWAADDYAISYDLAGGTAGVPANPVFYTVESTAITLTAPIRDGFTFTGWVGTGITDPTMSVTITTGSTGERAFTATWEENPAATLVITGPAMVTERDLTPFAVEAFDAHGVSLGDVTADVTFDGADTTGAGVAFPIAYATAGQTTTRTLTATLDGDPSVSGTADVQVVSAVTGIAITSPATANQGDTITVHVTATGTSGPLGDATAYAVITSGVLTDVIDGAQVSFPSASPHTLTITLGVLTATHTVEVTPIPAATSGLPATGAILSWGVVAAAGLLLALGGVITVTGYRRRQG
ncbi:InlB B-repeat-containing protein [Microbacterium sp. NPDC078428]|uniref:InlB B-repeat-containing protein n=1 Tax=Microbacterium sp. NPDC078428 TaxID=3364190 RepID=UPI0037C8A9D3